MTPATLDPEIIASGFFGPGNGLRWDGPDRSNLQHWIDDLRQHSRPIFLPRRLATGRVRWYALARDPKQARDLREQLAAFLGPTYSDFDGQPVTLDSADSVESILAGKFAAVFALNIVRAEDSAVAEEQVKRLRMLLSRRPPRPETNVISRARLVREFDLALRAADWPATERILAECRSRGQFSSHEIGGLKIRALADNGDWQAILDLPELTDILTHPRPTAVTEALQASLYHVHLASLLEAGRIDDAATLFRAKLALTFAALFRTRTAPPDSPAGKAAAVAAAAFAPQPTNVPPLKSSEEQAQQALDSNDYDAAYRLLLQCEPTPAVFAMLLLCADERVDSPLIAQTVLAMFDRAPQAVRDATLARKVHRRILSDLREHLTPAPELDEAQQIPTDWVDWLERLQRHGPWPKAAEAARAGVREWATEAIHDDPATQERFVGLLGSSHEPQTAAVLRNCLPQLLEAFLRGGAADCRLKSVYWKLLELFVFDSESGIASTAAIVELTGAILACGLTAGEFRELVEWLALAADRFRAPVQFERAVQLLDVLSVHGVHLQTDVGPLLQQIATAFRLTSGRVTDGQWAMFERVCADFSQSDLYQATRPAAPILVQEEDETTSFRRKLDGMTVALLTMTEQISATFLRALEHRFPKTRFKILHEADESKLLRDVARSADVFIVNTFDVPHMASVPVKKFRSEKNTLYPAGKTGLQQVEALYRWLRTGATEKKV